MTSVAQCTNSGAGRSVPDEASAVPGATHQHLRAPAALRHEQFHTVDPDAAQRFFASAYRPSWRIKGSARGWSVTHRRCAAALLAVDEIATQGQVDCEVRAANNIVVIQPQGGLLTVAGDLVARGDTPVLAAESMPCRLQLNAARFNAVSIEAELLQKVATERHTPLPQRIKFLSSEPRSPAGERIWRSALDYVNTTFASPDIAHHPLIVTAAAQLLAAAALECFPSNVTAGQDLLSNPEVPRTIQSAMSFIHRQAGTEIGVKDVAAEIHLTPRAVQYLFRQQLDTTPTEYLRRIRLHRAHQDLMAGHRSTTTVTQIAQRWQFAHTGRFAVLYRRTYGQSPHTTLNQSPPGDRD